MGKRSLLKRILLKENLEWERQWTPLVIDAIPSRLLVAPTGHDEEDLLFAADLVVIRCGNVKIAQRVRRPEYFDRYRDQFTIRYPSEWEKIAAGFCDFMCYCFANPAWEHVKSLRRWTIVQLAVVRSLYGDRPEICRGPIVNSDDTQFVWFDLRQLMAMNSDVVAARNWSELSS